MTRDEWIAELRGLLERRGAPASEVADALEYYAGAIRSIALSWGFPSGKRLRRSAAPRRACDAVAETVPVAKRAVAAATATRERKALIGVLLLVSAVFWVPLAFGLLGAVAGVYVTIWAAVLVVWTGVESLLACGLGAVPLACYSASCGALAEGLFSGGALLALGALGVMLVPLGIIASVLLFKASVLFVRWVAHFFLRVARGGQQPEPPALGAMAWLRRNAQAWKAFLLVGGVLLVVAAIAAGVALALGVPEPSLFPVRAADAQTPFGIAAFRHRRRCAGASNPLVGGGARTHGRRHVAVLMRIGIAAESKP